MGVFTFPSNICLILFILICDNPVLSDLNGEKLNHDDSGDDNTMHVASDSYADDIHRNLDWVYGGYSGQKRISGDEWLDYDKDELPKDLDKYDDEEDRLRSWDVCLANKQYSTENCVQPPSCNKKRQKLCINRAPIPGDVKNYYVRVMKCIPTWENCDKCMCGQIRQHGCEYFGKGQFPDDDRIVGESCTTIDISNRVKKRYKINRNDPASPNNPKWCQDEDLPRLKRRSPKTCAWVGEVSDRCELLVKHNGLMAKEYCRKTCGVCTASPVSVSVPTKRPTKRPIRRPTNPPVKSTKRPIKRPTNPPTKLTKRPTKRPTQRYTNYPTKSPIKPPTNNPINLVTSPTTNTQVARTCQAQLFTNNILYRDELSDFIFWTAVGQLISQPLSRGNKFITSLKSYFSNYRNIPMPSFDYLPMVIIEDFVEYGCFYNNDSDELIGYYCERTDRFNEVPSRMRIPFATMDDNIAQAIVVRLCYTISSHWDDILQITVGYFTEVLTGYDERGGIANFVPPPKNGSTASNLIPSRNSETNSNELDQPQQQKEEERIELFHTASSSSFMFSLLECREQMLTQNVFYRDELADYVYTLATDQILQQSILNNDTYFEIPKTLYPTSSNLPQGILQTFAYYGCLYGNPDDESVQVFCDQSQSLYVTEMETRLTSVPQRMRIPFMFVDDAATKDMIVENLCVAINDNWANVMEDIGQIYEQLLGS